jgi:7-cyano-7-deazaguanine reductase
MASCKNDGEKDSGDDTGHVGFLRLHFGAKTVYFEIYKAVQAKTRVPSRMTEPLDRRYDVQDISTLDVAVLETFPYEYSGKDITMHIETDEFTSVCPWSGLPDFATIRIDYIPGKVCIELRSLKYYLLSYRNVGIYQEHLVNRLLDDLVACAKPVWMKVVADYRIRGGVHTVASREYKAKRGAGKR